MTTAVMPMAAMPPTTPPTMAPILFDELKSEEPAVEVIVDVFDVLEVEEEVAVVGEVIPESSA